ncbi:MAG: TlpA family protein disulfide reductase [Tannerella sp.]|jgi:peroxiredoxin|nr:TlpA family protein disulfide reductase [Tannerella sp.]
MWKKYIYLWIALALLTSCNEKVAYQVKIDLDNLAGQTLYVVFESADLKLVDTLAYDGDGACTVTQPVEGFRTFTLYYGDQAQWITAYLEPYEKVTVTGDAGYPQTVEIKGGEINEMLSLFKKSVAPLLKEQADLMRNDSEKGEMANSGNTLRLANINHELNQQAEAFIRKYPNKEVSAILIRDYFSDSENPQFTDELLSVLDAQLDDFYVVKELNAFSRKARKTIIGAQAPDFEVRDIYGKTYSTASFGKNYYVVAFVAMWKDMCHTKDLFLDELIEAFPEDAVSVVLVCLDENPEEIRKATVNDAVRWNVVTDSAGQAIEMIDAYNVVSIPRCYLIDRSGKIVLKTDNGIELKRTLDELIPVK